jgi:la-related protein 4
VTVVDNKIRANIKPPGRSTLILREIPSDAPAEEVKEIFNFPGAKAVSSIRSEIGDTWFVTMESEEDAKDTLMDLRLKKRTFRGAAVKARLKTETVVRSFFPVQAGIAPVVPFPMAGGMQMPVVDMRAFGYMGMQMPVMQVDAGAEVGAAVPAENTPAAAVDTRSSPGKAAASATAPSSGAKEARAKGQNAPAAGKGSNSNAQGQRRQDGSNATGAAGANARGNAKGGAKEKKEEPVVRPTIELNLASFPPLGGEDQPIPTPGYKGPFHKYSGDEIISIAKGVKEAKLPESLNPVRIPLCASLLLVPSVSPLFASFPLQPQSQHPLAMTVEANKDLLKRQRTFSIDETREQLRQGRPVQREAILSGKVDSRSLYYGDEPSAPAAAKKEAAPAAAPVSSPSAAKKTAPAPPASEARAVAADVVEQVAASAANLAVSNPTIVEAMNSSTPQKITPSTWAAMIKSSAAATGGDSFGAKPAVPVAAVRTPAKEKPAAAASSATKAAKTGDKEKEGDGKTRRKNSGDNSRKADAGKESKEGGRRKSGSNAEAPGTPSRPVSVLNLHLFWTSLLHLDVVCVLSG